MRAKWRNHRACSTSIHQKPDATSSPCTPQLQDSCKSRRFKRFLHYSCTASVESRVAAGPLPGWRGLPTNGKYWSHAPLHVGFRVKNPALRCCLRRQKVRCTGPASDSLRLKQGDTYILYCTTCRYASASLTSCFTTRSALSFHPSGVSECAYLW